MYFYQIQDGIYRKNHPSIEMGGFFRAKFYTSLANKYHCYNI